MSLRDFMASNPHGRTGGCSICKHPRRADIEDAIREWVDLTPTERRNFGVRRLSTYVADEVLEGVEGSWPGRQTIERHRDACMEIDL